MSVEKEGGKKRKKRKKGRNPQENAKQLRGFAHARKIRLFPLETENGENNLCRLRILLGSRRFSPSLSFSFPYRLWWRYEGSVIAIINRAGVQRCRSTSRAIVFREQWRDRSHPRRRSIFIESSPAPPSLFPLTARFYRRYSTWCGKRFGTRLDRCSNEQRVGSGAVGVSPLENTLLSRWGRPETHQSRSPTLQMASDASTLSGPGLL